MDSPPGLNTQEQDRTGQPTGTGSPPGLARRLRLLLAIKSSLKPQLMVWARIQIKSNQIKSLLLSHHHSTSALVSEILESVLQTVQKNKTIYI